MADYVVDLADGRQEYVREVRKVRAVDGTLRFHADDPGVPSWAYGPLIRGYSLTHVISWERAPDAQA